MTTKEMATQSLRNSTGQPSGKLTILQAIEKQKKGFELALPNDFDADRFTRIALTAIKNFPKLMSCEPASVLGGLMLCAQLGLEPNSPLHEASLIPYGNKAQFQIEYRGLLKLVWNSGLIAYIDYDKVCTNDQFDYMKGFNPKFEHRPVWTDRGEAYLYYAIAELIGGGKVFVVKPKDEIQKHAARFSKAYGDKYKDAPWQTDFDSMAIKTVLKELCDKKLPKRTTNEALKFAKAISKDEHVNIISDEGLLRAQSRRLELDDIATEEDVSYEEVKDEPQDTNNDPSKYQTLDYWLLEIEKIEVLPHLMNFEKKHANDLNMFSGKDGELLKKVLSDKRESLKKKSSS